MGQAVQSVDSAQQAGGRLECEQLDPLAGDRWDRLVLAHGEHSVFHRAAWARTLHDAYGHRPFYLHFKLGGASVALVPLMEVSSRFTGRRGVCLPFADYCGPLWADRDRAEAVHAELIDFARARNWKHFELRDGSVAPAGARPARTYDGFHLDLSCGVGEIGKKLAAPVRRAIRKAERSPLKAIVSRSPRALEDYYKLHARTRRRHGLPPQPASFFRSLGRSVIEAGLGEVVLAKLGDQLVAGAVFLRSEGAALYKYGASDPGHWSLRPNQLVMWTAIRFLAEAGCRSLHFGRTAPGDKGLARFKRTWGSVNELIPYFRYHLGKAGWNCYTTQPPERHPLIFRWLPIRINRIAGSLIYPHLD